MLPVILRNQRREVGVFVTIFINKLSKLPSIISRSEVNMVLKYRSTVVSHILPVPKKHKIYRPQMENSNSNKTEPTMGQTNITKTDNAVFITKEGRVEKMSSHRLPIGTTGADESIKAFLARPYHVTTATWSTATAVNTNLITVVPSTVITGNTMWRRKLEGFRNWKADVHIKLEVAASPFHQGSFFLYWKPWSIYTGTRDRIHNNVICKSQLPGIFYTCEDNSVEITIPYIAPVDAYDSLSSNPWTWGSVCADVYTGLATGAGANSVTIDTYMWLENVELSGLIPQGSGSMVTRRTPKRVIPSDKEVNNGEGPVTRALGHGVRMAASLAEIPLFTPVMSPATWVLDKMNQVSSIFGWSKPSIGAGGKTSVVMRCSDAYNNNSNGTDSSMILAAKCDNSVTPSNMLTFRKEDENSLKFIARHWSYLQSFNLATSNSPGDLLYSLVLSPVNFASTTVFGTTPTARTAYYPTPLWWLSKSFCRWRGPLEFRFLIVKTGYHAGQVLFTYSLKDSLPSYTDTQFLHREIVDLQEGNEVCFVVPYARVEPFINNNENIGTLGVYLVNTLQAPSTVSNTITFQVFIRGGEGIEFTKQSTEMPIPTYFPQMWIPQGADVENEGAICVGENSPIGNSINKEKNQLLSQYAIGESIDSVLSLCKRFSCCSPFEPITNIPAALDVVFDPHYMGASYVTVAGAVADWTQIGPRGDFVSRLAFLYLYHRGSIKIKFKSNLLIADPSKMIVRFGLRPYGYYSCGFNTITTIPDNHVVPDIQNDLGTTAVSVTIPQYSGYYGYAHMSLGADVGLDVYGYDNTRVVVNSTQDWNVHMLQRAAGDDFHFSFFLGIPSCMMYSAFE
jgi:hypothetical protein